MFGSGEKLCDDNTKNMQFGKNYTENYESLTISFIKDTDEQIHLSRKNNRATMKKDMLEPKCVHAARRTKYMHKFMCFEQVRRARTCREETTTCRQRGTDRHN